MKFYKFGNKATSSVSSPASEHVQSAHIFCKVRDESMKLDKVAHFVLDECDQCLEKLDMRGDIQKIFLATPKKKQVMMSAFVHLLSSHRHTSWRAAACGRGASQSSPPHLALQGQLAFRGWGKSATQAEMKSNRSKGMLARSSLPLGA